MNESTDWERRDARFAAALAFYSPTMTRSELNSLRRSAGTLSPVSRLLGDGVSKASRFLWRLFDVEYIR
jgi:hypothetical protein